MQHHTKIIFLFTFFVLFINSLQAQEFNTEEQYKQSMQNAKLAFEAKQYSQAVVFYREALRIKPKALLPKYKIEDIRTIYIKKEIDLQQTAKKPKIKKKKRKKKEIDEEIKIAATKKMNKDAEEAKKELEELKITSVAEVIEEPKEQSKEEKPKKIEREKGLDEITSKKQNAIKYKSDNKQFTVKAKDVPKQEFEEVEIEQAKPKEEPKQKPKVKTKPQVTPKQKKTPPVPNKKNVLLKNKPKPKPKAKPTKPTKEWIQKENIRLAKKYPNKKTIEEVDKKNKHITRVIMNIDNKVTTYLKVKHSWGATFYFIDEVGLELRSISSTYFFRMTDLNTYK